MMEEKNGYSEKGGRKLSGADVKTKLLRVYEIRAKQQKFGTGIPLSRTGVLGHSAGEFETVVSSYRNQE